MKNVKIGDENERVIMGDSKRRVLVDNTCICRVCTCG